MDTGDILLQERTIVGPEETAGELAERLARVGADVLDRTLSELASLAPRPQDHAAATLAPRLRKEDGWIRLDEGARELVNRIRACNPWPGAALMAPAGRLLVWRALATTQAVAAPPGVLVSTEEGSPGLATGSGVLVPVEVQPENRRAMSWTEYLRGARLQPGAPFASIG